MSGLELEIEQPLVGLHGCVIGGVVLWKAVWADCSHRWEASWAHSMIWLHGACMRGVDKATGTSRAEAWMMMCR